MSLSRRGSPSADESRALDRYIREIGNFPLLTPEEEKELGRRIRSGDENAVQRLVECNLRFVVSYAKRYRGLGLSFLDLIHEGNVGLVEAARRFDPERNVKFISYAVWWIRQAIIQAISDHTRVFSVPARVSRAFQRMEHEFEAESAEAGTPAPQEVADSLEVSIDAVNAFLAVAGNDVSLSDPVGQEAGMEVGDRLKQESVPPVELELIQEGFLKQIHELVSELGPKEAEVIRLRFGLDGEEPCTLQTIGERLRLSRERIRQIENRAMTKLRRSGNTQALRGFLN